MMYGKEITAKQAAEMSKFYKNTEQTEALAKDYFMSEITGAAISGWNYIAVSYTSIRGISKEALTTWLEGLGYEVIDNEYNFINVRW